MSETKAKPVRLQRKRTKGFDMQAVSLATNGLPGKSVCRPGKWGNPFNIDKTRTKDDAIEMHKSWVKVSPELQEQIKKELRGFNLFCFCKEGEPCHADVLIEIANG